MEKWPTVTVKKEKKKKKSSQSLFEFSEIHIHLKANKVIIKINSQYVLKGKGPVFVAAQMLNNNSNESRQSA